MNPHVPVQFAGMFERSRANLAFVRSFFGVDASMHAEVFLHAKAFVAEFASVKKKRSLRLVSLIRILLKCLEWFEGRVLLTDNKISSRLWIRFINLLGHLKFVGNPLLMAMEFNIKT